MNPERNRISLSFINDTKLIPFIESLIADNIICPSVMSINGTVYTIKDGKLIRNKIPNMHKDDFPNLWEVIFKVVPPS